MGEYSLSQKVGSFSIFLACSRLSTAVSLTSAPCLTTEGSRRRKSLAFPCRESSQAATSGIFSLKIKGFPNHSHSVIVKSIGTNILYLIKALGSYFQSNYGMDLQYAHQTQNQTRNRYYPSMLLKIYSLCLSFFHLCHSLSQS